MAPRASSAACRDGWTRLGRSTSSFPAPNPDNPTLTRPAFVLAVDIWDQLIRIILGRLRPQRVRIPARFICFLGSNARFLAPFARFLPAFVRMLRGFVRFLRGNEHVLGGNARVNEGNEHNRSKLVRKIQVM